MRNIKLLITIFLSVGIADLSAGEFHIFNLPNIEYINTRSGKNVRTVNQTLDFNNIDKIKFINISVNNRNDFNKIKLTYENGLLIKKEETAHDGVVQTYLYDADSNIINVFPDFKFLYLDKNCRNRFYQNTLQGSEKIIEEVDKVTILFEGKFNKNKETTQKKRTNEFFYDEQNKLILFISTSFKFDGSTNGRVEIRYEYIDCYPEKITETYSDFKSDEIRSVVSIKYDEYKNISKIMKNFIKNNNENYEIFYSNYDEFGNWHLSKKYKGEVLIEKIEREIIYK